MIWLFMTMLQIITESMPISSSGHMQLLALWLQSWGLQLPAYHLLDELTALATLAIIVSCYAPFIKYALFTYSWSQIILFWWYVGVASLPTVGIYLLLHAYKWDLPALLPLGFLVTAGLLLSTRYAAVADVPFSFTPFFLIGCAQAITLACPGLSRMAVTYTVGCWLGIAAAQSLALSLAFEVPLLVGAIAKMILFSPALFSFYLEGEWLTSVLLGTSIGMFALRCIMMLAQHNQLWYISYYLIVPLILSLLFI